jgi:integrase
MAMVDLKGLYRVTAKGRVYWYAWRGGPRITAAHGTPAFAAEYAAHHAARRGGDKARISGLIVDWKSSDAWTLPPEKGGLAESTKKNWRGPLDAIQTHFGQVRVEAFDDQKAARRNIRQWLKAWSHRPRTCDMHKQVLSALLSYAKKEDRISDNPCFGIANAYETDRADIIWTDEDIMQLAGHASPEIMFVLGLACLTGLRQTDLLRLSWNHIDDLAVEIGTGKSRVRGRGQRAAVVPMYDELKRFLAVIPRNGPIVLTNSDGVPWRSGFPSSWNKALKAAGLQGRLHFNDSRGSFATATYELDVFTVKELAEMLAWSVDKVERIINRYVRRDALLRDKIRRIDEARKSEPLRNETAKPTAKPGYQK